MSVKTSLGSQSSARFLARRRTRRKRAAIAAFALLGALLVAGVYQIRQDSFRVAHVEVFGADESLAAAAYGAMEGYYAGLIPRNSTFFYPQSRIRSEILASHPGIAAVSFFRKGFTGLSIKASERTPVARWCGLSPTQGVEEYCYVSDASGLIFAPAGTSTEPINNFSLYAPLIGETEEPLRATIANADELPTTFDFARQLGNFGSPVERIVISGDEVHQHLRSGTRITYVLGNEENAFTALTSAKENINLIDGSVQYVDLRFGGKVYVKRK